MSNERAIEIMRHVLLANKFGAIYAVRVAKGKQDRFRSHSFAINFIIIYIFKFERAAGERRLERPDCKLHA